MKPPEKQKRAERRSHLRLRMIMIRVNFPRNILLPVAVCKSECHYKPLLAGAVAELRPVVTVRLAAG